MRPYMLAPVAIGALVAGYLWGYGVGEREGQDSDPESGDVRSRRMYEIGFRDGVHTVDRYRVERLMGANGG